MSNQISTIIFDFGNVIIDIDMSTTFQELSTLTGYDFTSLAEEETDLFLQYEKGQISSEAFLNKIIRKSKFPTQANDIVLIWNRILKSIPKDRIQLLESLKEKYNLYLLSNTNPLHIQWAHRYFKRTFNIENFETALFKQVFYSYQLACRKPEIVIYEKVQNQLQVEKSAILFIDDLTENIKTAQQYGWNASLHPAQGDLKNTLAQWGIKSA